MRFPRWSPHSLRVLLWAMAVSLGVSVHAVDVHAQGPADTAADANAFLDRFVGHWTGEGKGDDGAAIGDDLECERVLDGTFLFMRDAAIGGTFKSDTYLAYNAAAGRYELYTFNNNLALASGLPARVMTGRRDGNRLIVEESAGAGALRYTYEFLDKDSFRLTKAPLAGSGPAIVLETFRRK